MGSYGTGSLGRSAPAAAIVYQTTQASRQEPQSFQPPDVSEERTFRIDLGPEPEQPQLRKPKEHGWWCRHMHPEKHLAEQEKWRKAKKQYAQECQVYDEKMEARRNPEFKVSAAEHPPAELTPQEEAMLRARNEVPMLTKEIDQAREAVIRLQTKCEEVKEKAKTALRQKNQEFLARTFVGEFISARGHLESATRAYARKTTALDAIVETMEKYWEALDEKRRAEIHESLGMTTYENMLEVKALRDGMATFNMPASFYPAAQQKNEQEAQALMREFSAEAAQELHNALATPTEPAGQQVLPPVEVQPQRIPLAN